MKLATPAALLLLVIVPYFVWLGWPRLAYRRRRDLLSLTLRLLIVFLLIFGLAGLQTVQAADKLAVVFLVDASDSIDSTARAQAEQYIHDAMAKMTPDDRAGVVVFGKNALVDRPVSPVQEFGGITSNPVRLDSNIAAAIRLGLAMFPSGVAKRLVVLSDGVETLDSAVEAARLAAATNAQIDVVPLQRQAGPEVQVSDIRLPTTVNAGEEFDLGVTIDSTIATSATITVLSGGKVIKQQTENLKITSDTVKNNFVLSKISVPSQGFADFQVRVDLPNKADDSYYQNNELTGFTEVTGPPRVLIIADKPEEAAALLPSMQQAGLLVDVRAPTDLPIGLAPLAAYKSVVLANVPATALSDERMKVLQTYVRDLGGGLVVIGGPNSYGVGGYYQTPLEEVLPVDMQIKDQNRIPSLTMVYVIDRSGSMEITGSSGVTNFELAKEAARRSINFLYARDRAGVLSFDSNPQWLVPIQFVANQESIVRQIGSLRPGGGTDISAAVSEIARTLPSDPSTLKHVILLTDGGADPAGIIDMVRKMRAQNITVTSIGIGIGVPSFMRDIAVVGGGTYYNLIDLATVPQVFAAETVLATRSYIVEEEFTPRLTANSPIMRGIDAVPTLKGYVATTPKPTSTVILTAPVKGFNDPLLASWQYGLGRVVAWTSDATTRWAANWTSWEGFQRFWSQVIRSTIVEGIDNSLEARVEQRNGHSILIVEARDDNGAFLNSLTLDAAVVNPKLQSQTIKLQQVAPGRYEAEFDPQQEGAYFIRVAGSTVGVEGSPPLGVAQTTGWVLTYSPEYRIRTTNTALLDEIASLTGGRSVLATPETVFRHDIREETASTALWPYMLLLALLLLPLDIAVRRVVVTRTDLHRLQAWARKRLGMRDPLDLQAPSPRLAALKGAKLRATSTVSMVGSLPEADEYAPIATPVAVAEPVGVAAKTETGTVERPVERPKERPVERAAEPVVEPRRNPPPRPAPESSPDPSALASRLAERRRQRKDG